MKIIVLLDDICIEKLDNNYIFQSRHSDRYCLVNSDAYYMISMLPHMTAVEKDEIYRSNTTFWDTLIANGIVLVNEYKVEE